MYKWLFSLLLIVSISSSAQEVFFQEALKRGREKHEFYMGINNSKKTLTVEKVKEYCANNNYLVGKIETTSSTRFGKETHNVSWFEFLPAEEYEQYIYYNIASYITKHSYEDYKNVGLAIVYLYIQGSSQLLYRVPDTKWTGEIVDGRIEGSGVGFFYDKERAIIFSGTFHKGVPVNCESVSLHYQKKKPDSVFNEDELTEHKIITGYECDGMLSFTIEGKNGFMNEMGVEVIKPQFDKIIKPFTDGKAIVSRNDTTEIIIDKTGAVVGITDNQAKIFKEKQLAKLEKERAEAEEKRRAEEKRQEAIRKAEERRVNAIKKAQEGDKICYSQDWLQSSGNAVVDYIMGKKRFTMKVICFIEKNVNNGERLQVRIASIESSDDRYYSTPVIDGIKYNLNSVIWIRPLKNKGWWIED